MEFDCLLISEVYRPTTNPADEASGVGDVDEPVEDSATSARETEVCEGAETSAGCYGKIE